MVVPHKAIVVQDAKRATVGDTGETVVTRCLLQRRAENSAARGARITALEQLARVTCSGALRLAPMQTLLDYPDCSTSAARAMPTTLLRVWALNNARLATDCCSRAVAIDGKPYKVFGGCLDCKRCHPRRTTDTKLVRTEATRVCLNQDEARCAGGGPTAPAGSSEPRLDAIPFRNATSIVSVAVTNLFIDRRVPRPGRE